METHIISERTNLTPYLTALSGSGVTSSVQVNSAMAVFSEFIRLLLVIKRSP
ncbi:hypothetical protein [Coleofasciculus sp. FACHB-SPT9]|uniref:hypothetical protein n=1 Tax=Coleofasciculus sp. FACHB-SPT9 TaxID=2692791 RepID=UPI001684A128|nr:hypothetical protein [Coleofasciculus sp. FACHB-SPT9]MBD1890447.1 hypothetical protein [Coleofasciculus sp. FACHB-SPT9]